MQVLILGHQADAHAVHMYQTLEQTGVAVHYWDTRLLPTQLRLSWEPETQSGRLRLPDGPSINLQEVHSVFWRTLSESQIPDLPDVMLHRVAVNDSSSLVRSLLQGGPARWVNSWQAYQFHKEKPLQLAKVRQLGVPIPATLISNDPDQVADFLGAYPNAIFKPVYGGAHTQRVTPRHLENERLHRVLSLAPVTLQDYIKGTNVRCYMIGDMVYGAEIRSSAIDFREDLEAELIPMDVPEAIQQQCQEIAQALYLEWTAIDWRMSPDGNFIFLEATPSPMFLHFERKTGFPITQDLVRLLTTED
jgi:glutathione synthase/RimK-type ligase-like ATP-grasp enzyme